MQKHEVVEDHLKLLFPLDRSSRDPTLFTPFEKMFESEQSEISKNKQLPRANLGWSDMDSGHAPDIKSAYNTLPICFSSYVIELLDYPLNPPNIYIYIYIYIERERERYRTLYCVVF